MSRTSFIAVNIFITANLNNSPYVIHQVNYNCEKLRCKRNNINTCLQQFSLTQLFSTTAFGDVGSLKDFPWVTFDDFWREMFLQAAEWNRCPATNSVKAVKISYKYKFTTQIQYMWDSGSAASTHATGTLQWLWVDIYLQNYKLV